jgi:hypothetical protein
MPVRSSRPAIIALMAVLAMVPVVGAPRALAAEERPFAVVGGTVISWETYQQALRDGVRQRYYHGSVPTAEAESYRQEVADELVTRALLVQEADRRGIVADEAWVAGRLEALEKRYARQPGWETHRDQVLASARTALETRSRLTRLEAEARTVGEPGERELRAYYAANLDKFTEPARNRVSVILLGVEASAGAAAWQAAREAAGAIVAELRAGADFAEMARDLSSDPSAASGGDMGYLHRGMVGVPAQEALDELEPGEISDAVTLLEGIAVFRLEERVEPRVNDYDDVRERAATLWRREAEEAAWDDLLERLRAGTEIAVDAAGREAAPQEASR